jgi:hypothetical protein
LKDLTDLKNKIEWIDMQNGLDVGPKILKKQGKKLDVLENSSIILDKVFLLHYGNGKPLFKKKESFKQINYQRSNLNY